METQGKILIVDDEENIRSVLCRQIQRLGFLCEEAEDGLVALEKLAADDFDVALIDLKMPRMDGLELLREAGKRNCQAQFVILSGYGEVTNVVDAMKYGAFDFIEKPATSDLIQAIIKRAARHAFLKRHTKALTSLAKQWETIFDASPDMILVLDCKGRILRCNQATAERSGTSKEDLIGQFCFEVFDGFDCLPEFCSRAGSPGRARIMTTQIHHHDWGRHFLATRVPLKNGKGKTWGFFYTLRDITEAVGVEEELRAAHSEMEMVLRSISSILIGVGPDERVIRWNHTAEQVFGVSCAEVLGKRFTDCRIKWDWDLVLPVIRGSLENRESRRVDDIPFARPDGKEGMLGLTVNPFIKDSGETHGFLLLGSDITERKMLAAQLSHAQKLEAIGQLAAGIAHEINTPTQYVGDNTRFLKDSYQDLVGVMGKYRQLLDSVKQGTPSPDLIAEIEQASEEADIDYLLEEIPQAIGQSLEGLERVTKIVRAMKEFSHPGTEEKTAIDINKSLESTITVSRNEWKYVAEMVTNFDETLPPVPCLPGDLNQVILNLIVNASHAIAYVVDERSGEKGTITISTKRDGDWLEIRISDTGGGIPDSVRHRIFDPFFTTKDVGKGTGQGLAIARSVVVDKHQGTIDFETEEGKGTTFVIRLHIENETE